MTAKLFINDYLSDMAERAASLAAMNATELRLLHPDNVDGIKRYPASVAECIEAILVEEFLFESGFEVPQ